MHWTQRDIKWEWIDNAQLVWRGLHFSLGCGACATLDTYSKTNDSTNTPWYHRYVPLRLVRMTSSWHPPQTCTSHLFLLLHVRGGSAAQWCAVPRSATGGALPVRYHCSVFCWWCRDPHWHWSSALQTAPCCTYIFFLLSLCLSSTYFYSHCITPFSHADSLCLLRSLTGQCNSIFQSVFFSYWTIWLTLLWI